MKSMEQRLISNGYEVTLYGEYGIIGVKYEYGFALIASYAIDDKFTLGMRRDIIRLSKLYSIIIEVDGIESRDLIARSLARYDMTKFVYGNSLYLMKIKDI